MEYIWCNKTCHSYLKEDVNSKLRHEKKKFFSRNPFNYCTFTLIELLIVLSILGILLTLLIPSLNNAREKARQGLCLNNLNQVGQALYIYISKEDLYLPGPLYHGQTSLYNSRNSHNLGMYLGELSVSEKAKTAGYFNFPLLNCPSYNGTINGAPPEKTVQFVAAGVHIINGTYRRPFGYPGSHSQVTLNHIDKPAERQAVSEFSNFEYGIWGGSITSPRHGYKLGEALGVKLYFDGRVSLNTDRLK